MKAKRRTADASIQLAVARRIQHLRIDVLSLVSKKSARMTVQPSNGWPVAVGACGDLLRVAYACQQRCCTQNEHNALQGEHIRRLPIEIAFAQVERGCKTIVTLDNGCTTILDNSYSPAESMCSPLALRAKGHYTLIPLQA